MFLLVVLFHLISIHLSEVVSLVPDTYHSTLSNGKIFVKYFSPNCGHCKALAPTYIELGKEFEKYKDKVTIAEVDCVQYSSLCEQAQVTGWPTLKFYKTGESDIVEYSGDRSLEDLAKFVAEQIGVFYKQKPSRVKVLTPDTFDQVAYDPDLNVFVSFTASWCGHCKRLKPELNIAANSFKDSDKVVIAYIDIDAYQGWGPQYEVHGFPTIKFFPAANKKDTTVIPEEEKVGRLFKGNYPIIDYSGEREAAGIVRYINKRSGTYRVVGGGYEEFVGLESTMVAPVQALSKALMNEEKNASAINEAEIKALDATKNILNSYVAATYERYINKLVSENKGLEFAKKEIDRLSKVLENGKIADEKLFELLVRKNILGLFTQTA